MNGLKRLSIVVMAVLLLAVCSAVVGVTPQPALADEETPTPALGITGFWGEVDFPADNDDGVKVTDVAVKFTSSGGKRYAVHIHEDGTYAIVGLPPGQYTIELWPASFAVSYKPPYAVASASVESARLKKGQNLRLDLGYVVEQVEEVPPTPTPTPTPYPILGSGIYPPAHVASGLEVLEVIEMDTDDDGEEEAILINGLPDASGIQVVIVDREDEEVRDYYLIGYPDGADTSVGSVDRIDVQDIDGEKPAEVIIHYTPVWGEYHFLNIFRWSEDNYNNLTSQGSPGRLALEDVDGDGVDELLTVEPIEELEGKVSQVSVYRWTRESGEDYEYYYYEPTGEEYRCPTFLEDVVELYYQAINARDYEVAYSYWGAAMQARQSYQDFEAGFATTVEVKIVEQKVVEDSPDSRVEQVTIEATDEKDEETIVSRFSITWTLGFEKGCPRLLKAEVKEIE